MCNEPCNLLYCLYTINLLFCNFDFLNIVNLYYKWVSNSIIQNVVIFNSNSNYFNNTHTYTYTHTHTRTHGCDRCDTSTYKYAILCYMYTINNNNRIHAFSQGDNVLPINGTALEKKMLPSYITYISLGWICLWK